MLLTDDIELDVEFSDTDPLVIEYLRQPLAREAAGEDVPDKLLPKLQSEQESLRDWFERQVGE